MSILVHFYYRVIILYFNLNILNSVLQPGIGWISKPLVWWPPIGSASQLSRTEYNLEVVCPNDRIVLLSLWTLANEDLITFCHNWHSKNYNSYLRLLFVFSYILFITDFQHSAIWCEAKKRPKCTIKINDCNKTEPILARFFCCNRS